MSTEETALSQVILELIEDSDAELPDYQIAIEQADLELVLPAVVISARHQEDTGILLGGLAEVKRYVLSIEIRGIQTQDDSGGLDEAVQEIDVALHPTSPQTVTSGAAFQGVMIDVQRDSDSTLPKDARIRRVGYDIFAAPAVVEEFVGTFRPADVNAGADYINFVGLTNGQQIRFAKTNPNNNLPAPIVEGQWYYVVSASLSTFQISETSGGAVLPLNNSGTGNNNEIWRKTLAGS